MSPNNRIVEAEAFVVRDSQGQKRGFFGMEGEEPVLKLCDSEGQTRIVLRLTTDVCGGTLSAEPEGGHVGLSLTAGSEGIALFGRDGKLHLMILGMPDGTSFYVYDSNNRVRLRIDVRDAASGVSLHGKSADKRALFGTLQDEAMILLHGEGEQLVVLDAQGLRREPQE